MSGMQRAAHAALQAARLHAAAAHAARAAAAAGLPTNAAQLQRPCGDPCLQLLRPLSSGILRDGGSAWQKPTSGSSMISTMPSRIDCTAYAGVSCADSQSPAALQHRRQHRNTSGVASFVSMQLSSSGTISFGAAAPGSRDAQQAGRIQQAAAATFRYRGYASRATQALTKGHAPLPAGQAISMRIAVASPNQIAEPYRYS